MVNFNDVSSEKKIDYYPNCPYILDHSHRILIIGGSESWKTNALLNLVNHRPDIDKIYLNVKDVY